MESVLSVGVGILVVVVIVWGGIVSMAMVEGRVGSSEIVVQAAEVVGP